MIILIPPLFLLIDGLANDLIILQVQDWQPPVAAAASSNMLQLQVWQKAPSNFKQISQNIARTPFSGNQKRHLFHPDL